MPEFIPEHDSVAATDFLRGYDLVENLGKNDENGFKSIEMLEGYASELKL